MSHTIKKDKFGLYVRLNGMVFRPLFPIDYPPRPHESKLIEGIIVECQHQAHTPLASIRYTVSHGPNRGTVHSEMWFSHGGYIRTDGSFKHSTASYKPLGFTWPGGVGDRNVEVSHNA